MKTNHPGTSNHKNPCFRRPCNSSMRRIRFFLSAFLISCLTILSLPMVAQPSGGPYGPIHQTYSLPVVPGKIYYVAMDGQAGTNGETPDLPTTLTAAIERVKTGDAIVMRGGTYRTGNLLLNQGITIQAYADEQPVMKGTLEATEWQNLGNGLWVTSWTNLFPARPESWWQRLRSGKQTPLHRFNNDMVFVDGKFLQSAGWEGEVDDNTFYIDYEAGRIYIGTDPANRLVEITAFDCAIHRITHECHGKVSDKKGPVIRGITFTQYAYRAIEIDGTNPEGISPESNHGKEVTGTILEHCTISYCSRVAAYLRGDNMIIRHCRISDTSTEGIYILSSSDVLLERNIFMRNNIEMITGYYPAAVKIFNQCYRVTFLDNLVTDLPNSNGVWYDVGNVDGRFLNNWVQNVGTTGMDVTRRRPWPSDNGFFFEISKGAVCAGNVFVNCDNGIFVLNSSDVQIYQNTMVNSSVCIARDARSAVGDHFGWHPSTGPDVDKRDGHIFINNLLTGDENFHHPLLNVWQPETLCEQLDNPMLKQFDFNVYVRNSTRVSDPLIFWSPVKNTGCWISLTSLDSLRALHPEFESGGRFYSAYNGPLFISRELGNYQILKGFPGSTVASPLPPQISKLLGRTAKGKAWTGAYPPF